ncbi:MAG: hypothetical protein K1X44_02795 [Alphaproteobacteria bacterium]|nr:hypothetical protein [Alphaproteobacteria bacterium]
MISDYPAIIIHSLKDAQNALSIAHDLKIKVNIWSEKGAAIYTGVGWFYEIISLCQQQFASTLNKAVLDCDDRQDIVQMAFHYGINDAYFHGNDIIIRKLQSICSYYKATLHLTRPDHIFNMHHLDEPEEKCKIWLSTYSIYNSNYSYS